MTHDHSPLLNRRQLMGLGGGAAAALVLGGQPAAMAETSTATGGQLPESPRFDLTDGSYPVMKTRRTLHNSTVMQCFGFDTPNGHVYTTQVIEGGLGKHRKIPYKERLAEGDLCITRLSATGKELGHMYVRGFGHGGFLGVEPVGKGEWPYLWTEYAAETSSGGIGFGSKIARFRYMDDVVVDHNNSPDSERRVNLTEHTPTVDALPISDDDTLRHPRPAIDPKYNRLLVRFQLKSSISTKRAAVYDLDDAKANDWSRPLAYVPELPQHYSFTMYGQYMYLLYGDPYGQGGSTPPDGNTHITCVDLNSGKVVEKRLTRALKSLDYREPEGMSIKLNPSSSSPDAPEPEPWLCFGFASGDPGARRASIAYKDKLV